jgi:adenylyltransferase/sulfurtransferase
MNPDVHVEVYPVFLSAANALDLISRFDVVVNGSDNFPTRYLVNDAAVLSAKPWIDAAVLRFEGQLAVFWPGQGCYRCLFPAPPPPELVATCEEVGILGAVAGVMGSLEAVEALKLLLAMEVPAAGGRFLVYDAVTARFRSLPFQRDRACPLCGDRPTIDHLVDYAAFCGMPLPGDGEPNPNGWDRAVAEALTQVGQGTVHVLDVRSPQEYGNGHLPGAERVDLEALERWVGTRTGDRPLLVVCAQGIRSTWAARYLRSRGIAAWGLAGGIAAWKAAGGELVAGDG